MTVPENRHEWVFFLLAHGRAAIYFIKVRPPGEFLTRAFRPDVGNPDLMVLAPHGGLRGGFRRRWLGRPVCGQRDLGPQPEDKRLSRMRGRAG